MDSSTTSSAHGRHRIARRHPYRAFTAAVAVAFACTASEAPTRSLDATVTVTVPDFRIAPYLMDVRSVEVVVGQSRSIGSFTRFGGATVSASQFGQSTTVPVNLGCGTTSGCTLQARLRLLGEGGQPIDSADGPTFALAGEQTVSAGGFVLRSARRIVAAEPRVVLPFSTPRVIAMTVLDDADRPLLGRRLSWSSSDPTVATVDSTGRATGVRPGRAVITATHAQASAATEVVLNSVQSLTLTASATRVMATVPVQLTTALVVVPGISTRVQYRSSDTTVAVVSDAGMVQTRGAGTVSITVVPDADTLERRSLSLTVDPFRAAISYTNGQVLPRGDVQSSLLGVWGDRFTNLVAVGCGQPVRWNGTSWRAEGVAFGFCAYGVAGTGADNIVAVGSQVWRFNGTSWARESFTPSAELYSAVAVDNAIYAVGVNGQIHRRTTAGWSAMTSGTTRILRNVHGVSSANVWAVGDGGVMLRFNGTAWETMVPAGGPFLDCRSVHVRSVSDVLAACNEPGWGWGIQRWNGTGWTRMSTPSPEYITDLAEGNGQLWAVANHRTVWRLEGQQWVADASRLGDVQLQQLYADADGVMVVGNDGLTMRRVNAQWTLLTGYPQYDAVWAHSGDFIVAAGTRGAVDVFDGTRWTVSRPIGDDHMIRDVWGAGKDAVFAAGALGTMLHFDGLAWRQMTMPTSAWIQGVWGVARDSVWAVAGSDILFYDGTRWAVTFRTGRPLLDIHGRDARNIVAVGNEGRVWRFDGRTWTREESNTDASLRAVFVGPTRTFAASADELHVQLNGEWQEPTRFAGNNFLWMAGSGDSDVYVGGCGASTRRFDGVTWVTEPTTNACTLSGAVLPGGGLIVGGVVRDFVSGTGPRGNTPGRTP